VTNIDISAPLGKRQFFWDGLFYWGDRINPFVPAIDCIISKVHHAFFVSFKYFHAVRTGKSHGKEASISEGQPVDGWLYLEEQRPCQNDEFHTFLKITDTYPNNEESKTKDNV